MPIHDLICGRCANIELDVAVVAGRYPKCKECGGKQKWFPSKVNVDAWGGPTYVASMDKTYDSKSSLKAELKRLGLEPAGDRVGGARTETYRKGERMHFSMK